MKIEKISESKIKVNISPDDLEERNLDPGTLNYNSPAAQELFWDVMEQAEIQFGFTASESQLFVEAFPDVEDGFVVTITKVDGDGDFESIHKYIKNRFRNSDLKVKKKNRKICSTIVIYAFENFDDLVALGKKVHSIYKGDSSVFKVKNKYYLILTRNNLTISNPKIFEAILDEYGNKINYVSFFEGYLNEHGEKIMDLNAFEIINCFF